MSDITLAMDLSGLVALVGAWALAASFSLATAVFVVTSLRTGKRHVWGRRVVVSAALAIGCFMGGFAIQLTSRGTRDILDKWVFAWSIGVLVAGGFWCSRVGREPRPSSTEGSEN